jgi:hypothetical protein
MGEGGVDAALVVATTVHIAGKKVGGAVFGVMQEVMKERAGEAELIGASRFDEADLFCIDTMVKWTYAGSILVIGGPYVFLANGKR